MSSSVRKCTDSDSSRVCAKYYPGLYFPLMQSVVFIDSLSAESDGSDKQADLGLCCPHMPGDKFLHGTVHIILSG